MQPSSIKACKVVDFFNMSQDSRHLMVVDLREGAQFDKCSLRGSISISSSASVFMRQVDELNKKSISNEEKYKTKAIRRIVFVHQDPTKILAEKDQIMDLIAATMQDYKLYYLNTPLSDCIDQFPFLFLSSEQLAEYHQPLKAGGIQIYITKVEVSLYQRSVLYAYSQFPSILVEGEIYLGNNYNSNSEKQLNDLKIKSLMDFNVASNTYEQDVQSTFKYQHFQYIHVPIDTSLAYIIDFNEINEKIESLPKPIMLYCQDGCSKTNTIAIAYLIWKKKLRCDIASLKVFQIKGQTTVDKKLYAQLMTYDPSVQIIKV